MGLNIPEKDFEVDPEYCGKPLKNFQHKSGMI